MSHPSILCWRQSELLVLSMRHFRCWRNFGFYNPRARQNCITTPPRQTCHLLCYTTATTWLQTVTAGLQRGLLPVSTSPQGRLDILLWKPSCWGITFLKPKQIREIKTYLYKSFHSDKPVHQHCFQLQWKGRLILLPGNFSFPQLGPQRQLCSELKDFQRLKRDPKVWPLP